MGYHWGQLGLKPAGGPLNAHNEPQNCSRGEKWGIYPSAPILAVGGPSWDPLLLGSSSPKPLAGLTPRGSIIGQERQEATGLLGLSEPAWWEAEGFGGGVAVSARENKP